jgi:hypothetical protein
MWKDLNNFCSFHFSKKKQQQTTSHIGQIDKKAKALG